MHDPAATSATTEQVSQVYVRQFETEGGPALIEARTAVRQSDMLAVQPQDAPREQQVTLGWTGCDEDIAPAVDRVAKLDQDMLIDEACQRFVVDAVGDGVTPEEDAVAVDGMRNESWRSCREGARPDRRRASPCMLAVDGRDRSVACAQLVVLGRDQNGGPYASRMTKLPLLSRSFMTEAGVSPLQRRNCRRRRTRQCDFGVPLARSNDASTSASASVRPTQSAPSTDLPGSRSL